MNDPRPVRRDWAALLGIAVVLASLWMHLQVALRTTMPAPVRADAALYVAYAHNLRAHGVFSSVPTWAEPTRAPVPDKITLPGYPALLAVLLDGPPDMAFVHRVRMVQALLGALTTLFVLLAARLVMPRYWALIPAGLTAASPHLLASSAYLLTESLFACLVAGSLYAMARLAASPPRSVGERPCSSASSQQPPAWCDRNGCW